VTIKASESPKCATTALFPVNPTITAVVPSFTDLLLNSSFTKPNDRLIAFFTIPGSSPKTLPTFGPSNFANVLALTNADS
jgi:hypothetical protein